MNQQYSPEIINNPLLFNFIEELRRLIGQRGNTITTTIGTKYINVNDVSPDGKSNLLARIDRKTLDVLSPTGKAPRGNLNNTYGGFDLIDQYGVIVNANKYKTRLAQLNQQSTTSLTPPLTTSVTPPLTSQIPPTTSLAPTTMPLASTTMPLAPTTIPLAPTTMPLAPTTLPPTMPLASTTLPIKLPLTGQLKSPTLPLSNQVKSPLTTTTQPISPIITLPQVPTIRKPPTPVNISLITTSTKPTMSINDKFELMLRSVSQKNVLHNLFTYETVTQGEENKIYKNCILLKPVGAYKQGDYVPSITINVELYLWTSEEGLVEDEVFYI